LKTKISLIIAFIFITIALVVVDAPAKAEEIHVYLNGLEIEYSSDQPYSSRNEVYLPFEDTLEQLGFEVSYNSAEQIFTVKQNGDEAVTFLLGELIDQSGRLFIEAGSISDLWDYVVEWNPRTSRLSMSNNGVIYRTARDPLPILMYHHFDEEQDSSTIVSPVNFENQLRTLQENDYITLSSEEAYNYLKGKQIFPKKPVYITFDDGYESNYSKAFPLLQKYNSKATIFAITSQLREDANRNYGQYIMKLSWDQVAELAESGLVEVHSHTHAMHYKANVKGKIDDEGAITGPIEMDGRFETEDEYAARVLKDLEDSMALLEKLTGEKPFVFCYPFGSFSRSSESLLKDSGFLMSLTTRTGINTLRKNENNTFGLKRVNITNQDVGESFLAKITGEAR